MLGECKCCEVLKKQNEYLQGLLDRTLEIIAPKPQEIIFPELNNDAEGDIIQQVGEG